MIRPRSYAAFIFLFMSAIAHASQNGVATAAADVSIWQPSKDCALEMRDGQFVLLSSGNDPYIISTEIPDAAGPFTVDLRTKSNSRGPTQFYWSPKTNKAQFGPERHVDFAFVHDGEWHDYSVRIETPDMGRLRLDPSTASGECLIAFIRVKDKSGKIVSDWRLGDGGPAKDFPNAKANAQIRAPFKNSEIVITTTTRLAGAIHSLTWNGKEFINSVDHGRQLQSATNLDCGTKMKAETFNPTEAGSRDDGIGQVSSSRLLDISAIGNELKTTVQMAFWLNPGERSGGELAKNATTLSNHLVAKRVHIGHKDAPNIIEYDTTFTVPNEVHKQLVIEAVTGYMQSDFKNFYKRDPQSGELSTVEDGPGEQAWPLVFATENGGHAMGIFAPKKQPRAGAAARYGRFRFVHEKVVKWNCVFRLIDSAGIKPGDYSYNMFVVVGTLEDVKAGLNSLAKEFNE